MIHLLQIINYMYHLEYTESDVKQYMTQIETGVLSWDDLLDGLGLELSHPDMVKYINVSKWESANHVIKMKRGLI